VRGLPVTIPPNGRNRVVIHIEARAPGEFEEEVTFYTDRPSQPKMILRIQGTIREIDHDAMAQTSE
jgi:hypothetical protein